MTDKLAKTLTLEEFDAKLAELKTLQEEYEAIPRSPDEPPRPGILRAFSPVTASRIE